MTAYEDAIEIKNVTKRYDGFTLDNIRFAVPKGCIMGFIGQNGAGKTTTIRSLLHITNIDSGEIRLLGLDHIKDETAIKQRIAVVFDELPFHDVFTAKDMARILEGMYPRWDHAVYAQYLERFQLPTKKKIGQFSKGMKMKLQIAAALSHNAKLLIMDEATTGLDPVVRNEILDIFLEYLQDGERSILMSSHITSDLEHIADMVTFIDKGKLLISGVKDEILDNYGMVKCSKTDFNGFAREDYIAARLTDFGAQLLVSDRAATEKKYSGVMIEKTSLEEIMLYYVNRDRDSFR